MCIEKITLSLHSNVLNFNTRQNFVRFYCDSSGQRSTKIRWSFEDFTAKSRFDPEYQTKSSVVIAGPAERALRRSLDYRYIDDEDRIDGDSDAYIDTDEEEDF